MRVRMRAWLCACSNTRVGAVPADSVFAGCICWVRWSGVPRTEAEAKLGTPVVSTGENSKSAGDDGDYFYVLERGNAEVFVPKLGPDPVMTYSSGASFGELALMYNCPRAATVKVRLGPIRRARSRPSVSHTALLHSPSPSVPLPPSRPSLGAGLTCVNSMAAARCFSLVCVLSARRLESACCGGLIGHHSSCCWSCT